MHIKLIQAFLILLISAGITQAQDITITSLSNNGQITWSNSASEGYCTVEWAPSLTGQWYSSWENLSSLPVTNSIMSADVPMFYRILWKDNNNITANFNQSIGTGNALYANFNGTLSNTVIVTGSVSVNDSGSQSLFDSNGDGILTGNGTGSINYQTGDIVVSFTHAPSIGNNIIVSYSYYTSVVTSFVESIGVGNGTEPNIYGTLTKTPAIRNSIHITAEDKSFTDDGNGALIGDGFGTINYDTGEIWAGFSNAPNAGVNIFAEYYY